VPRLGGACPWGLGSCLWPPEWVHRSAARSRRAVSPRDSHWRLITQRRWGKKQRPIHLGQGKRTGPWRSRCRRWQRHLSQGHGHSNKHKVGVLLSPLAPKTQHGPCEPLVHPLSPFSFPVAVLVLSTAGGEANPLPRCRERHSGLLRGRRRLTACYQSWHTRSLRKLLRSMSHLLCVIDLALVLLLPRDGLYKAACDRPGSAGYLPDGRLWSGGAGAR